MPAAVMIVLLLGAIAVDLSIVALRHQQAVDAAASAANDAATAGLDRNALRTGKGYALDPGLVRQAVDHSIASQGLTDLLAAPPEVGRPTPRSVRVVLTLRADYVFARALPDMPRSTTVQGRGHRRRRVRPRMTATSRTHHPPAATCKGDSHVRCGPTDHGRAAGGRPSREHTFNFDIAATPEEVWKALHPPIRPSPDGGPRVIEHGDVRITVLFEGDADGQGLVRTCTYRVPKLLLSGGVGGLVGVRRRARARPSSRATRPSASRCRPRRRAGTASSPSATAAPASTSARPTTPSTR